MNEYWTTAANEVANVWHAAQANPFHAFALTAVVILGGVGLRGVVKDQIRLHRASKENQERFNRLPRPPEFDPSKFEAADRSPK